MRFIFFIVGIVIVAILIKVFFDNKKEESSYQKFPYKKKKFLTDSELRFFRELEEKYASQYYILSQVPLSGIVSVDLPVKFYGYKGYRSKIDKKIIDFVLFDKDTFAPVLVIELDDYTHNRPNRKARDMFLDSIMEKVGIKIEHVKNPY